MHHVTYPRHIVDYAQKITDGWKKMRKGVSLYYALKMN